MSQHRRLLVEVVSGPMQSRGNVRKGIWRSWVISLFVSPESRARWQIRPRFIEIRRENKVHF